MTQISIASWNINSVRLRIDTVSRFLQEYQPDVLCLQETKVVNDQFPDKMFRKLGYEHIVLNGQKAYHGVAIVSRLPLQPSETREFCKKGDSRHVAAVLPGGIDLHNFYVPAGGDEPDPEINEKFAHKLAFLTEMAEWFEAWPQKSAQRVLVGDLNVAPLEHDVWSHKQMLKIVSHTPVEIDHLNRVQQAAGWIDVARQFIPPEEKHYTWWSYRAADWLASNRGRRLDHIWVSPGLEGAPQSFQVARDVRGWPQPSDHAPVIVRLKL
ncbi:MAG: exodeoxyribonuclease III [Alphaproteobacteria bacterium]|nr:exodeoxyribonuclease III [Alphaproteobacteria bacterium]